MCPSIFSGQTHAHMTCEENFSVCSTHKEVYHFGNSDMFSVTQIPAKEQRSCDQWCECPQTTCSYDGLPSVAGEYGVGYVVEDGSLLFVTCPSSSSHPLSLSVGLFYCQCSELFLAVRSWWLNCMLEIERVSFLVRLPPCCAVLSLENFGFRSSSSRAVELGGKERRFLCAVTMVQDLLSCGGFLFNMD